MIKAREHQIEHIEKGVAEISSKRKVLMQLPTGGGKTVEFALICKRFIINKDKSVLILIHREELMHQAKRTIKDILNIDAYLITSKTKKFYVSKVYIGMVESVTARLSLFNDVGLVIIDECHIANFNKVHSIFLEELIMGFTATPKSSSKKEPMNKYYQSIVTGPQINELIQLGYLAQNITRCPKDVVDSTKFEIDARKGDFNEGKMALEYSKPRFVDNLVRTLLKYCKKEKTIIFNVTIAHSIEVNDMLCNFGVNSRHIDATSRTRASQVIGFANEADEILHWFKVTPDAVLNNVMIATVGFDEPTIRNVILNFSTLSLPKFLQCSGRGGRIIDMQLAEKLGCLTKNSFNLIDMGGNCVRFGDWNDDRDWNYIFDNPDKASEGGIAPVKTCPKCEGLVHAAVSICPLENEKGEKCLYEFDKKKVQEEKEFSEMVLITKNINIDELIKKNSKKYDYYTFLEIGEKVVKQMYERYRVISDTVLKRAFEVYYELCKEWYKVTLAGKDGKIEDISNSKWHIARARYNFDTFVTKYKTQYEQINSNICHICGAETDYNCDACEYPVCEKCMVSKGVSRCTKCGTNDKRFYDSLGF